MGDLMHALPAIPDAANAIPDIEFDWVALDYENGLDTNFTDINDCLNDAIDGGLETEVVFTALKNMKENSNLTIGEAIKIGFDEWIK